MPRRKSKKPRPLSLIEILVLVAIGAILLSIVIPASKKKAAEKRLRDKTTIVKSYGEGRDKAGETLGLLGIGFGLGGWRHAPLSAPATAIVSLPPCRRLGGRVESDPLS